MVVLGCSTQKDKWMGKVIDIDEYKKARQERIDNCPYRSSFSPRCLFQHLTGQENSTLSYTLFCNYKNCPSKLIKGK